MIKKITILFITLLAINFSTQAQSKKELKKQQQEENFNKTKELITSENYTFKATMARSERGISRDVRVDGYSLTINQQKAIANLPFFGQAQSASYGGSSDDGFSFTSNETTYNVSYNDKKLKSIVKFRVTDHGETFLCALSVLSNGKATLTIASNRRDSMSYDGMISKE